MITPRLVERAVAWTLVAAAALTGSLMIVVGLFADLVALFRSAGHSSTPRQ